MAKRRLNIPLTFGVHGGDVDKKHAPFGFLKTAKNVRMRERGRLGTRKGFSPLAMTTGNGTMRAFDLHEHKGRAIAFGSDDGAGAPTDLFEYTGLATGAWRGTDALEQRVMLNPFTNPRERAGILQMESNLLQMDSALSTGHVALLYCLGGGGRVIYAVVVDKDTDQVVLQECLTRSGGAFVGGGGAEKFAVRTIGARFYVSAVLLTNHIQIIHYEPGVHARFAVIATPKNDATAVIAIDMCAITRPSAQRVVVAWSETTTVRVKVYNAAGTLGTSFTFTAAANVIHIAVEADETDDTINVYTVETPTTGVLRTFQLSTGALLDGPTATTVGATGSIGRLFAQGSIGESIAVGVNEADDDLVIQVFDIDSHAVAETITVKNVALRSRLGNAQTPAQDIALVFSGLVGPALPAFDQATNALLYATPDVLHMSTRDFVRGRDPGYFTNMAGKVSPAASVSTTLCWLASRDPGTDAEVGMPVVTLVDCLSTERRQVANYGGLLYVTGATVGVYDSRVLGELGFNEAPGIVSVTAGSSGGDLEGGATYYYALHWEIVLADGSLMVSPVSIGGNAGESITDQAFSVELGPSDNRATIVGTCPHTVRIAASDALFGATVTAVLSRTEWISLSTTPAVYGTRDFTNEPGAAGDFTGLTLEISVDGGGTQTVTFGATDDAVSELADAINAQTTGLLASVESGALVIESETEGATASIEIIGGTATVAGVGFVGFLPGDNAVGETTGSPGSVLRRVATRSLFSESTNGSTVSFSDTIGDDELGDNEPIYTQGDRGILSGPLEQHAPRGCSFITATESRLLTAGLARSYEAQISREAFLSEPFSFSEFSAFFAKSVGPVIAVESLDQVKLMFTADTVLALPGEGPDDLGGGGVGSPVQITSPGGLREDGWRSLLKVPEGLFFQMSDDKLMLLPRGAQSPAWAGEALASALVAFPAISGATRSRRDHAAIFALTTATDGRLALLDFRVGEWFIDTVPLQASSGIDAVIETDDGIAYLSGGVVYRQTDAFVDGTVTPISTELETHPIYPFGVGGHGQVYEALFVGELEGACDLTLSWSIDDGATYTALTTKSLTGTAGATVKRAWTIPDCVCGSVTFKLTKSGAVANGGVIFNDLTLLVEDQPGLELLPSDDYG
jgi:hypothetical protein